MLPKLKGRIIAALLLAACLPAAGCERAPQDRATAPARATQAEADKSGHGMDVPVTYAGVIPCADCPGIRMTLTLLPEGIALLRSTYLEADAGQDLSMVELLAWSVTPNGRQLKLAGRRSERPQLFAIQDSRTLLKLGREGRPPESGLDYTLTRASVVDPIEGPLSLEGYYRYMADAGLFEECRTGARFPVSQEADNAALERAYLEAVTEAGAPMFVTMEGRLAMRPAMEGEGSEDLSIVPERFGRVVPGGHCARPPQ